jgi:hypothetical protein
MRARWPILAAVVVLGAGYLGYPYVTLYELDTAMRRADPKTLRTLVDWPAVREGFKEDISDMVLEAPPDARPSNELAPFGQSFVHGMTGNVVDRTVTPETLLSLTHAARHTVYGDAHVVWAFFNSPTGFSVAVRAEGSAEPIRLAMELRHLRWQVHRVWLPNELLERVPSGT